MNTIFDLSCYLLRSADNIPGVLGLYAFDNSIHLTIDLFEKLFLLSGKVKMYRWNSQIFPVVLTVILDGWLIYAIVDNNYVINNNIIVENLEKFDSNRRD